MIVKGWASKSTLDHYRHVVEPSAFTASITEKGLGGPQGIKLLHQHNHDKVIGRITKLQPRNSGVWIEAEVDEENSHAKDVVYQIRMNKGLSFSVGFVPLDMDLEEDANGREFLRMLRGELVEVSIVTFPGNDDCVMEEYA